MGRRIVGLGACLSLLGFASPQVSFEETEPFLERTAPPNVLVLLADDLGVDKVGVYGEAANPPPTPHLDQMAARGILFRNAWSNPVCAPTRATLLTGRYSFRTGIGGVRAPSGPWSLGLSEVTIPEMLGLGETRYGTAAFAKWHLTNDSPFTHPNDQGFDHFAGVWFNVDRGSDNAYDYSFFQKVVQGELGDVSAYAPTDKVDDALEWIAAAPGPWFVYLAFNSPHTPFHAPPQNLHTQNLSDAACAAGGTGDEIRCYDAMVEAMDTEIGRLIAGIDPQVLDNTVVMFLGDNGTPGRAGEPPRIANHSKGSTYEKGINVPLIVTGPMVTQPGAESLALVNTTDVFATIAEIAGVSLDEEMPPETILDSVSFLPHLRDPSAPTTRQFVFAERFWPNSTAGAFPGPPTHCFQDLPSTQGSGQARLTLCGDTPLYESSTVSVSLTGGPAHVPAALVVSPSFFPTRAFGGVVIPGFPFSISWFQTDAQGRLEESLVLPSQVYGSDLWAQMLLEDPNQPAGLQITSAQYVFLPERVERAIRNPAGYKLITRPSAGLAREEFFYLPDDPLEVDNLLETGMNAVELTFYLQLHQQLEQILRTASE